MKTDPTRDETSPEFDQFAPTYRELLDDPARERFSKDPLHFHRRKWTLLEGLLKRTGVPLSALRWLDVGCGQGELLELGGAKFAKAMGCDPSAGMLGSGSTFEMHQQPSPVELPFADNSVDFVSAVCVYHHVHGAARAMLTNEIGRVLAPGGICCVIEHNPWNPVTRGIVARCAVDVDAELLTAATARTLFEDCGFKALQTRYFLFFPEPIYKRLGAFEPILGGVPLGGQYALLATPSKLASATSGH